MMKNLKQILLTVAFVVGISISASAQKEDKKPPPKEPPPVIVPKPKPSPKGDKKPRTMIFNKRYELHGKKTNQVLANT